MSEHRPEAVLFDAGGTLVVIDAVTLAGRLDPLGVAVPQQDRVTAAHYRAMAEYSDRLSAGDDLHWHWWIRRFLDHCDIEATEPVFAAVDKCRWLWHHALPGVVEAVSLLSSRGIRVAVVSNSDGTVGEELVTAGFDGLFETVVDSHVVGVSKPDPRIFAIALDRLGVPATSTWYVGDSPHHDLGGASAAGLGRVYLVDPLGLHQPRAGDDPVGSYQPWVGIVGSVADLVGRAEFAP
ncbi:MAG TPA: HAD family hydrolase [Acidimicrobiia bacterium]|jgi:putative hydrolase of the HAD superfamily|nr:HAD family hydrolase [Acidimicrobiia bacterium]